MPRVPPTLGQVNLLRLSRSTVVRLQSHYRPDELCEAVKGCFVRVLLESAEGGAQLYRVAQISGTTIGESYSGYSFTDESTQTYLDLDVPQALGHSTSQIQLNSISNSDFTAAEYDTWLPMVTQEGNIPDLGAMQAKARELVGALTAAGVIPDAALRPESFAPQAADGHAPAAAAGGGGAAGAAPTRRADAARRSNDQKKRKLPGGGGADDAEVQQLQKECEELRERVHKRKDHPVDVTSLSMDELNALEDSVSEYLTSVRDRKREMTNCKICMDREISVVLLPCKHQALCRACAYQVTNCPLCRTKIQDRIMPPRFHRMV